MFPDVIVQRDTNFNQQIKKKAEFVILIPDGICFN